MPTVRLPHGTMAFEDRGHGDALVMLHGHPFDRTMWQPQLDVSGELGWRVIAPDLRGYGASVPAEGITGFEQFALDVAGLLDALQLDRVVLAGLSMGGQVAMEFYRLFPGRLRGLILADTSARADTGQVRRGRRQAADRLLAEGMGTYALGFLPKMLAPATIAGRPETARHVLAMMRRTSPGGAAAALRARAGRPDYRGLLGRIGFPVLVAVGTQDTLTPPADAEELAAHIPGADLLLVEHAAHLPNLEQPEAFNAGLARFLARLDPVAARSGPECP
jgi:pimeloyl-ACP methyl ester carboxylesterase